MVLRISRLKDGQAILEYALVIAVFVSALIGMGAYVRRSMQGQLQAAGDQIGDQYAHGLTEGYESSHSSTRSLELNTPGWSHPVSISFSHGSFSSRKERDIVPLSESWYPGRDD